MSIASATPTCGSSRCRQARAKRWWATCCGSRTCRQQLKARIQERAEGNPFYLEEILRSLIDEGAIVQEEATGRWLATRDVAEIAIPDTLQGVLLARIDRLQEETKRVLQMASVIGRDLSLPGAGGHRRRGAATWMGSC